MATVTMTNGHRYKFAASAGTPVLLESSDNVGDINYFHNALHIEDVESSIGSTGFVTIKGDNANTSYGPQILCWNIGSGDAGIAFRTDSVYWHVGQDNSQSNRFSIGNSHAIGTSVAISIDTSEDVTIHQDLAINGELDMTDGQIKNVKEIQFQDWDDNTNAHDTTRILMRDQTIFVYNGGLAVGNYSNDVLGDIMDTQLEVEDKISVGLGNTGTTSAIGQGGNETWLECYMVSTGTAGYNAAGNGQNAGWMRWSSDTNNYVLLGLDVEQERFRMLYYDGSNWEGFKTDKSGNMEINGSYSSSDLRLKENVNTVTNALSLIKQMRGVTFDWKKASDPGKKHSAGVIAQEIEAIEGISPGLIYTDSTIITYDEDGNVDEGCPSIDNKKSANYPAFTAYLIEAVKELSAKIDSLESRINVLENA